MSLMNSAAFPSVCSIAVYWQIVSSQICGIDFYFPLLILNLFYIVQKGTV